MKARIGFAGVNLITVPDGWKVVNDPNCKNLTLKGDKVYDPMYRKFMSITSGEVGDFVGNFHKVIRRIHMEKSK